MKYLLNKKNITQNILGWRTNRKLIIIESDDWGSIRMPSRNIYEKLISRGIKADQCHYMKYDSLASEEDISFLLELLQKFGKKFKNSPLITMNSCMCNPDFKKIEESNYKEYFFQDFIDTLNQYELHSNSFNLWKEGINNQLLFPQFHCREHLNVKRWLNSLQKGSKDTLLGFKYRMYGISNHVSNEDRKSLMAAFDFDEIEEIEYQKKIIAEGLNIFNKIFDYKSHSFMPPNYTWHPYLEDSLIREEVKYIQGASIQRIPSINESAIKRHYLGQVSNDNLIYLLRNCRFEPASNTNKDWVDSCLAEIRSAFFFKKPAIIESHRVNYIGYINNLNRDRNLKSLEKLLTSIFKIWPDVEFINSVQLGNLISRSYGKQY